MKCAIYIITKNLNLQLRNEMFNALDRLVYLIRRLANCFSSAFEKLKYYNIYKSLLDTDKKIFTFKSQITTSPSKLHVLKCVTFPLSSL
jgi:hypothetical protein